MRAKPKEEEKPQTEQPLSANPMIARAQQAGAAAGVKTYVLEDEEQIAKTIGRRSAEVAADFRPGNDAIVINAKSKYWSQAEIDAVAQAGLALDQRPDHVINHELGHRAHRQAVGSERWNDQAVAIPDGPMKKRIEAEVSQYAATQRVEFVAEVYAGLKAGKTYSEKIMAYYKLQGGVIPR